MGESQGAPILNSTKFWRAITVASDFACGLEHDYDDKFGSVYCYTNRVGNHMRVSAGDFLLLDDRKKLLGVGRIENVTEHPATLSLNSCPACGSSFVRERKKTTPRYRCQDCGHVCDSLTLKHVEGLRFRAIYESHFCLARGNADTKFLQAACTKFSRRLSIQRLDESKLIPLAELEPEVWALLYERNSHSRFSAQTALRT
jgi:hypothetical protein